MKYPITSTIYIGLLLCWMTVWSIGCPTQRTIEFVQEPNTREHNILDASEPSTENVHRQEKKRELRPEVIPEKSVSSDITLTRDGKEVCVSTVCIQAPSKSIPKDKVKVRIATTQQAPPGSLTPTFDIGPDSWFPTGDVRIKFDIQAVRLPKGAVKADLRVAFVKDGKWLFVPSVLENGGNSIVGVTSHFSVWGVVLTRRKCVTDGDCYDSEQCARGECTTATCRVQADCSRGLTCNQNVCSLSECSKKTERCNRIDDDCDGQVDEGCTGCRDGVKQACGSTLGVCQIGQTTCARGVWGACIGGRNPSSESCNDLDDDCDGQVDESCSSCASSADCSRGEICNGISRVCIVSCPSGQHACGRQCVDLQSSNTHCGGCQNPCTGGTRCSSGLCR